MPNLSLLGCGGHGWENCSELVQSWNGDVFLWFETVDWGGFTGVWGRFLESQEGSVNKQLHLFNMPIFSWGDTNKALGFFMGSKRNLQQCWLERCSTLEDINKQFEIFSSLIYLSEKEKELFLDYLFSAYTGLNSFQKETNLTSRPPALAHFFSPWLLSNQKTMENWNSWWHEKNILPTHIHLYFSHTQRTTLIGRDIHQQHLVGEDIIDDYPLQIQPKSLNIEAAANSNLHPEILSILANSIVVIPTGTIANWIALVNNVEIQLILKNKIKNTFFWVANLAKSLQEWDTEVYAQYFKELQLSPNVILGQLDNNINNTNLINTGLTITSAKADYGVQFSAPNRSDIANIVTTASRLLNTGK